MKALGIFNLLLSIILLIFIIGLVKEKGWTIFLSFIAGMNFFCFIDSLLMEDYVK